MAALQGTILASKIVPTDSLDTYATHEDKYGRGGHRSVDTLEERDNITTPRRKEGMTVYVKENKTKYILEGGIDNTNWKVDISGGGSGGSVDLSDYYKKTETYSKIEVDTKISDIPPTDLSGYYKKTETETLLSNKIDKGVGVVGATKTKVTYNNDGIITGGADLVEADLPNISQAKITNLVSDLSNKQDTLVSATNIKTINGESVLGSGNINIEGGDSLPIYTEDDKNKVLTIDEVSGAPSWQPSKGGSGSSTFTGTASIDIGGVKVGDSWDSAPIEDVVNSIINPELFPAFINPTFSFVSTASGFREVGSITDITFNVNFSRGSITPQYSAENNYRSGLPTAYNYSGPAGSEVKVSNALTDTKTITGYSIAIGNNTFSCSVDYSIGTQPKSSKGNDYNTPLPAGTLSAKSVTIAGVYPVYRGIGTLSKIPLQAHGTVIVVDAPADMDVNGNRFTIQYPNVWSGKTPIVQQENELSKAWDNQNMAEYEITDIGISGIPYKQVKYIGSGIGARKLKLVF